MSGRSNWRCRSSVWQALSVKHIKHITGMWSQRCILAIGEIPYASDASDMHLMHQRHATPCASDTHLCIRDTPMHQRHTLCIRDAPYASETHLMHQRHTVCTIVNFSAFLVTFQTGRSLNRSQLNSLSGFIALDLRIPQRLLQLKPEEHWLVSILGGLVTTLLSHSELKSPLFLLLFTIHSLTSGLPDP